MKQKGALPYAYTANLGPPDETDYNEIPRRALEYGAEKARVVDCRSVGPRRHRCHTGWRFPHQHRRHPLFQHHASGSRCTGTMLVTAMREDDVNIWATAPPSNSDAI